VVGLQSIHFLQESSAAQQRLFGFRGHGTTVLDVACEITVRTGGYEVLERLKDTIGVLDGISAQRESQYNTGYKHDGKAPSHW